MLKKEGFKWSTTLFNIIRWQYLWDVPWNIEFMIVFLPRKFLLNSVKIKNDLIVNKYYLYNIRKYTFLVDKIFDRLFFKCICLYHISLYHISLYHLLINLRDVGWKGEKAASWVARRGLRSVRIGSLNPHLLD